VIRLALDRLRASAPHASDGSATEQAIESLVSASCTHGERRW
jgi:hypothetical protein